MTEIPEHLLQRSKARRAALGLGGDDTPGAGATDAPAATSTPAAAAPAPAAKTLAPIPAAAPPKPPAPPAPWVVAAQRRVRPPVFALVGLVALPFWGVVYAATNDAPTAAELGPLEEGAVVYEKCATCHGPSGAGVGSFPALDGGKVIETFPEPFEQMKWVYLGSDGWKSEVGAQYGATNKDVTTGMPPWSTLTPEEFVTVVLHERHTLSEEEFDIEAWTAAAEKMAEDETFDPAFAEEVATIIEEWEAEPPVEG